MNQHDLFDPGDKMAVKFQQYHQRNPEIFEAFRDKTLEIIRQGRKYYGAKGIIEVLRWERAVSGDDGFKINNNYAPYYARMFEAKLPKYKGFFKKRGLKA